MPISNIPVTQATSLPDLIAYAQDESQKLLAGEEFMVKDLFLGYEWKRIKIGNRTRLGAAFFLFAQSTGAAQFDILGKTPQNQQLYRRK